MDECIFCKIRDKQIPKEFTYEDSDIMVFPDISPMKPIHLLIIPKEHIPDFMQVKPELMQKITNIIQKMIGEKDLSTKGYRLVVNGGGAQLVNHLHIHLLGPMGKAVKE